METTPNQSLLIAYIPSSSARIIIQIVWMSFDEHPKLGPCPSCRSGNKSLHILLLQEVQTIVSSCNNHSGFIMWDISPF